MPSLYLRRRICFHQTALVLADQIETAGTRLVTTRAVLLEIGNALSKQRYREAASHLLFALENDSNVEILPLTEQLYARALQLYQERPDKDWGLTDCVSFVVMQDHGITEALTADEHFQQAGFRALMREGYIAAVEHMQQNDLARLAGSFCWLTGAAPGDPRGDNGGLREWPRPLGAD